MNFGKRDSIAFVVSQPGAVAISMSCPISRLLDKARAKKALANGDGRNGQARHRWSL